MQTIAAYRLRCSFATVLNLDSALNLWIDRAVSFHITSHDVGVHFSNLVVLPGYQCDMNMRNNSLVVGQTRVAIASIRDVHDSNHRIASLIIHLHPGSSVLTKRLYATHPRPWRRVHIVHNLDS